MLALVIPLVEDGRERSCIGHVQGRCRGGWLGETVSLIYGAQLSLSVRLRGAPPLRLLAAPSSAGLDARLLARWSESIVVGSSAPTVVVS